MRALDTPEIDADLALQIEIIRFGEILAQQNILGRDRGIGFQLEYPVPVLALLPQQRAGRAIYVGLDPVQRSRVGHGVTHRHAFK